MLKLIFDNPPPQPKTLAEAHAIIKTLWHLVGELNERVEQLEEQSEVHSGNSSRPPSQDSLKQRAKRKKKPPSSRQHGAQPGHKKHQREMLPEDQVNQVQRFFPPGRCTCGGEVKPETRASYRHQVFDVPDVKFTVTEYQVYAGACCQCRCRSVGKLPDWVPSGQMGAGLISWIALLSGQYRLSTRQIQSLLQEQWHLGFSLGAISQAQKPVSGWLQPIYAQIGAAVRRADIAHADETTHYRGGERRWLWTLCTPFAIYFLTHYSRGKGAAAELLGAFNGILISDRHGGYNDHPPDQRQLCWAHIIRNMERIAERKGQAGRLGQRLVRWARLTIRVEHRWRSSQYASDIYRQRLIQLRRHFYAELEIGSTQCAKTKTGNQCRRLLRDETMLWTFLRHPGIPLTNNAAERALRPYVIWRKTSFASQSYRGDQFRPLILSITETCKRLGVSAYSLLRSACEQGQRGEPVSVRLPIPQTNLLLTA